MNNKIFMEQLPPIQRLEKMDDQVDSVLLELRQQYQEILDTLTGFTYDTIEQRQELAKKINLIASEIGCQFRCITCGELASFRWSKAGNTKLGLFGFAHGGRTTHSVGNAIPSLVLDAIPKNKRKGMKSD